MSAEGNLLTASEAGIQEWAETGTRLATKWSGNATKVTFSPDGRWAAITLDEETQIVNIADGVPAIDIANARCSFSARGQYLAAWTLEAREVQVWRLSGDEPVTVDPLAISLDAEPSKGSGPPQLRGDGRS